MEFKKNKRCVNAVQMPRDLASYLPKHTFLSKFLLTDEHLAYKHGNGLNNTKRRGVMFPVLSVFNHLLHNKCI